MEPYKTVCDKCGRKTWYETEQQCHCNFPDNDGTPDTTRCTGTLKIIDYSALDSRFTRFYDADERVEVVWKDGYEDYTGYGCRTDGKKARFYVGKSTGWKPVYLQILQKNSTGGAAILSSAVESVRGLGIYRR